MRAHKVGGGMAMLLKPVLYPRVLWLSYACALLDSVLLDGIPPGDALFEVSQCW
jgi:hypothetical protein